MQNYNKVEIKDGYIYYKLNDKLHRTDGPAMIIYYPDGTLSSEDCYIIGKHHRTDGPAMIFYNKDGSIQSEHYYLNGEQVLKESIINIAVGKNE